MIEVEDIEREFIRFKTVDGHYFKICIADICGYGIRRSRYHTQYGQLSAPNKTTIRTVQDEEYVAYIDDLPQKVAEDAYIRGSELNEIRRKRKKKNATTQYRPENDAKSHEKGEKPHSS